MKKNTLLFSSLGILFLGLFLVSCFNKEANLESQLQKFIESQITMKNPEQYLELYADDMVYKDIVREQEITEKELFAQSITTFWKDSLRRFHQDFPKAIVVENYYIKENTAIIKGMITPYYYNNNLIEHKDFITYLKFNKDGKIIEHTDWVDYPIELILENYQLKQNLDNAVIGSENP